MNSVTKASEVTYFVRRFGVSIVMWLAIAWANRFEAPRTKLSNVYRVGKLETGADGRSGDAEGGGDSSTSAASEGAVGSTVRATSRLSPLAWATSLVIS